MKGSIRFLLGLLIVFGAVGGMEHETATMSEGILLSIIGLISMFSGVNAMNEQEKM